jgi:acetylornithine deacetylase
LPRKPDVAVVLEPTGLDVVVAHKGVVRWRCHAHGRAAHSSCPQAGENAIYRMAAVVAAIERYARDALSAAAAHPLCGRGTLSVGTIAGGAGVNTVPDRCTIEIDCRFPPGQSSETARQELIACLQSQGLTAGVEHEPPFLSAPALSDADNGPLAARLAACASAAGGTCRTLGVPYASEAAFLAAAGIPTVVFGPGHVEQAHTADEWVAVDEVRRAEETLYRFGIEAG